MRARKGSSHQSRTSPEESTLQSIDRLQKIEKPMAQSPSA
jgi:hypothetical protein